MRFSKPVTVSFALVIAIGASVLAVSPTAQAASATEADRASLTEYISRVDPICEQARIKMAASLKSFEQHELTNSSLRGKKVRLAKPKDVTAYITANLRYLEAQQVDIKKQKLPSGPYGPQLTELWKKTDEVIAQLKKDPTEAAFIDPFRPMAKELDTLGFAKCLQSKRPKTD